MGAGAQRGRGLVAGGGAGLELGLEGVAAQRHRLGGPLERRRAALGVAHQRAILLGAAAQRLERAGALDALALGPLGQAALGAQVPDQLGAAHRVGPLRSALLCGAR